MRKLLMTALVAVFALSLLASAASANRGAEVSPNELILTIFPNLVFGGGFGSITCPVTLHGSLHQTVAKVRGALAGYVTSVTIGITSCRESFGVGNVTDIRVLSLPWHLTYDEFAGTLPNPERIRLVQQNASFLIDFEIFGSDARCLYITNQAVDTFLDEENVVESVRVVRQAANRPIRPPSTSNCPEGTLEGGGTLTDLEGGPVTVTLI